MAIEIKVPSPGESINEVQLASWLVEDGAFVDKDQDIAEIDSDKATLSISASASGIITLIAKAGDTIEVGAVIASISPAEGKASGTVSPKPTTEKPKAKVAEQNIQTKPEQKVSSSADIAVKHDLQLSPLARKLMETEGIGESELLELIKHYRFGKKDVAFFSQHAANKPAEGKNVHDKASDSADWQGGRNADRKKISMLRRKLAERLVSVKNETAMLTTFNEVNMTPIMEIRKQYKELFKEKHGVGLGFMSFFTKAVTEALKSYPQVNAQIDGDELVQFNYADISIAVSGPKGLVVPVIRNAETLSLAQIESAVKELAIKARDNKLSLEEMSGGTFTITNGGVFGSMLSTPILNPPQSGILGMHNIVERPIAVNGRVEVHPMMYVALSYDHRIIDGRESVGFLVKVKEMLENPSRMLFGSKDPVEALLEL
ncbi:MAG: 2-oxoglutarate dehydrogenase complex dihydrolipoyllysine-residue succinyltransferase [Bacteroidales bacterium]|nr:2-oxoglutarate dehydrogenase complex dihydrolipoyllysine-residue succinyltransferase [Bacteroidales bacterium]